MMEINSLTDVINNLNLDVYQRVAVSELTSIGKNEVGVKLYEQVNKEIEDFIDTHPTDTYIYQPKNRKFFLPPFPELLETLGTNLDDETKYRKLEENKRKNEQVKAFACADNMLVIITKTKDNHIVYYTYNYDYEELHKVFLMSRVEYEW